MRYRISQWQHFKCQNIATLMVMLESRNCDGQSWGCQFADFVSSATSEDNFDCCHMCLACSSWAPTRKILDESISNFIISQGPVHLSTFPKRTLDSTKTLVQSALMEAHQIRYVWKDRSRGAMTEPHWINIAKVMPVLEAVSKLPNRQDRQLPEHGKQFY